MPFRRPPGLTVSVLLSVLALRPKNKIVVVVVYLESQIIS